MKTSNFPFFQAWQMVAKLNNSLPNNHGSKFDAITFFEKKSPLCSFFLCAASPYTSLPHKLQNLGPLLIFLGFLLLTPVILIDLCPLIWIFFEYLLDLLLMVSLVSNSVWRVSAGSWEFSSVLTLQNNSSLWIVSKYSQNWCY